eukprot:scaffold143_cov154-Amphora_coffeaeformis.AAC.5
MGNTDKLNKFLELNPTVPRDQVFVDDYNLKAYTAAGFGKLEMGSKLPEGVSLQPPRLGGFGGWWKYLKNVVSVSPVPSDTVTSKQVVESVSVLGGTFIVKGEDVIYQWNDVIPGDTPDLEKVLAIVQENA